MGKECGPFKFTQEPLKEPQGPHDSVPSPLGPRSVPACRRRRRRHPRAPAMEPPGPRPFPAPHSAGELQDSGGTAGGPPLLEHNGSLKKPPPTPGRGPRSFTGWETPASLWGCGPFKTPRLDLGCPCPFKKTPPSL